MGAIGACWLESAQKREIVFTTVQGKEAGIAVRRTCRMWGIERRRVTRWRTRIKHGLSLENQKPGPKAPVHRLLPVERQAVLTMAREQRYADLSHRLLAVTAWDERLFFVCFSSVYRILRSEGLMALRGKHGYHSGKSVPPVRKALTGPNQRWCWDISFLATFEKGLFLYLYLLLDEYSRKAIHWLVSWHQRALEAKRLIEGGLLAENILDLPENQRPEIVNDRGGQMKAKSVIGKNPHPRVLQAKIADSIIRSFLIQVPGFDLGDLQVLQLDEKMILVASLLGINEPDKEIIGELESVLKKKMGEPNLRLVVKLIRTRLYGRTGPLRLEIAGFSELSAEQQVKADEIIRFLKSEFEKTPDSFITGINYTLIEDVFHILVETGGPRPFARQTVADLERRVREIAGTPVRIYVYFTSEAVVTSQGYEPYSDTARRIFKKQKPAFYQDFKKIVEASGL